MLPQVQAVAELAMTDACTISRGGTRTFNPATMTYSTGFGDPKYTGPCRIQPVAARDNIVDAGGDLVTLRRYSILLPITTTGIQVDDHLSITACTDPQMVGRVLRVHDVTGGTFEGQRHLICLDDLG